jgi:hypothetical protein
MGERNIWHSRRLAGQEVVDVKLLLFHPSCKNTSTLLLHNGTSIGGYSILSDCNCIVMRCFSSIVGDA